MLLEIVAPLMTPILGVVLSLVTRDCKNLLVSIWLVFSGAMIAIGVGFVYGYFLEDTSILKENNSQIAARTLPRLTDLIAALATGAVGSIAMVREDISSTLPGVSIAISLVPPLNVVGLTLSTRSWEDAVGAMVLFLTNVSSILFVGCCTLLSYKVNLAANEIRGCLHRTLHCSVSSCVVFSMFLLVLAVATPLALASWFIRHSYDIADCVESELTPMLEPLEFDITQVGVTPSFREFGVFFAEAIVAGQNPDFVAYPLPEPDWGSEILDICDIQKLTVTHFPVQTYVVAEL